MTCPMSGLEDRVKIKGLILSRLKAEGQPGATPRIVRRYIETQLNMKKKSLDTSKGYINELIKEVIKENYVDETPSTPPKASQKSRKSKQTKPKKRRASPASNQTSPHYNMLRRLCFVVKINCNRLGIGGKNLREKMAILSAALAEKGFDAESLNSANIEETLEMAEMERDRDELAASAPALESGSRRKRSTTSYTEFFESVPVTDASAAEEDTDGDADDESDHVGDDSSSDFKHNSDESDDDDDDDDDFGESEEDEKPAPKKKRAPKRKVAKTQKKKVKKTPSKAMDVEVEVLSKKRKRTAVSYIESDEASEEEQHRNKRRAVISDDEEEDSDFSAMSE